MLEAVRRWLRRLPPDERDMPILRHAGRSWTPRQILAEVERGTSLGRELQAQLERLVLGLSEEEIPLQLAEERLRAFLERFIEQFGEEKPVFITLSEGAIPAGELLRQVRERRGLGAELLDGERKYVLSLLRLFGG